MDYVLRDPKLLQTVRALTIHYRSGMNRSLDAFEEEMHGRSICAHAILGFVESEAVGWLLLANEADHIYFRPKNDQLVSHIFVKFQYRRQGIGSQLMDKAAQMAADKKLTVYNHDNPNFFNNRKRAGLNLMYIDD